jgi:hypothetical protein
LFFSHCNFLRKMYTLHKGQAQLSNCDTNCNPCYPALLLYCPELQNKWE